MPRDLPNGVPAAAAMAALAAAAAAAAEAVLAAMDVAVVAAAATAATAAMAVAAAPAAEDICGRGRLCEGRGRGRSRRARCGSRGGRRREKIEPKWRRVYFNTCCLKPCAPVW